MTTGRIVRKNAKQSNIGVVKLFASACKAYWESVALSVIEN